MLFPLLIIACVDASSGPGGDGAASTGTGDTAPAPIPPPDCDDTYPWEDDCAQVAYKHWDPTRACWIVENARRYAEYWEGFHDHCNLVYLDTGSGQPLTQTYWLSDVEQCASFVPLEGECDVGDPAIRPCGEAPFDCCGLDAPNVDTLCPPE